MEATTKQLTKAHLLGYRAAVESRPRAAALNKELMKIVAELSAPDHAGSKAIIEVLQNYNLGYQMYCDQLAAEALK